MRLCVWFKITRGLENTPYAASSSEGYDWSADSLPGANIWWDKQMLNHLVSHWLQRNANVPFCLEQIFETGPVLDIETKIPGN